MRVKLSEPCVLEGVKYKAGNVVEVADNIQELNSGWMKKTHDELTKPNEAPTAAELAETNAETAHAADAAQDVKAAKKNR